jgi:hypothetical protein
MSNCGFVDTDPTAKQSFSSKHWVENHLRDKFVPTCTEMACPGLKEDMSSHSRVSIYTFESLDQEQTALHRCWIATCLSEEGRYNSTMQRPFCSS